MLKLKLQSLLLKRVETFQVQRESRRLWKLIRYWKAQIGTRKEIMMSRIQFQGSQCCQISKREETHRSKAQLREVPKILKGQALKKIMISKLMNLSIS